MNFEHDEAQRLLADSLARFLSKDYDFDKRRGIVASTEGWSERVWSTLASIGVLGQAFSAEDGGFGGGALDLMAAMEAFGSALLVEPVLPTAQAGRLVARVGSEAQKQALLPRVIDGAMRLAFAHAEPGARFDLDAVRTQARREGARWTLTGEKCAVVGAPMADSILVSARTDAGVGLFLVEPKRARLSARRTLDGLLVADIALQGVEGERLGEDSDARPAIEEAVDFATALVCAEAVGAMTFACRTTLEYLKTRRQFGVPIGSFQALQHRMVDMYIACELSRSMAFLACAKVDAAENADDRARAVSAAKIKVSEAARLVSQEAVQLHGGMGMTEELKVSHTFRRLTVIAQQFGDRDHHLARFAAPYAMRMAR